MCRLSFAAAASILLAASPCLAEEAGPFGLPCFSFCGPAEGGAAPQRPSVARPGHHRMRRSSWHARHRDDAERPAPRRRRAAWRGDRPDRASLPRRHHFAPVAQRDEAAARRAPVPPRPAAKPRPTPAAVEPATVEPLPDVPVAPLE